MKLRHLQVFLAVAEELHFTRAARRLGVAQPAVSAAIRELEEEMGVSLFDRGRRRVVLTAAGRRFQDEARDALDRLQRGVTAAQRVARGETGPLAQEPLTQEPLVAVLPAHHPGARGPTVAVAAVVGEPMLILPRRSEPAMHAAWHRLCAEAGVAPRLELELDQMESVLAFVAAGAGVSLAPASVARLRMDGVVYRPLSPPIPAGVTLLWNPERLSPAARALRETIRSIRDGAPP